MMQFFFSACFSGNFCDIGFMQAPGDMPRLDQSRAAGQDSLEEAVPETAIQSLPSSSSEKGNSEKSPLVTPSAASLSESVTQGREGRSCSVGRMYLNIRNF